MMSNPDITNDALDTATDDLWLHSSAYALLCLTLRLMVIEKAMPLNHPEIVKSIAVLNRTVSELEHRIHIATVGG
jgi:hypothetical protein